MTERRHTLPLPLGDEVPFSKGLMARALVVTGLDPERAYLIARYADKDLNERGVLSLDFDRLVLTGSGGGTALLGADGRRSTSGDLAGLSGRAMAGSAVIRGEPDRLIRIAMPKRIELHGMTGGRIRIERLETDVPPVARLSPAGRLEFRFGGELWIEGDLEGDFRGQVPITVEYL